MKPLPPQDLAIYWRQLRKPLELELSRGCPDKAIAGASIGAYTLLWAQRLQEGSEEDVHLAQSIARGLRDYAGMPVAERRRRAMAAIDLLVKREEEGRKPIPAKPKPTVTRAPATRQTSKPKPTAPPIALPHGNELLEMPLQLMAPRAKWPQIMAKGLGIETVRDLLYHIPRDWVDIRPISELVDEERAALVGTVTRRESDKLRSNKTSHPLYKYTLTVTDDTGEAWVSAISSLPERNANRKQSWNPATMQFKPGQRIFVLGKVERAGRIIELHMDDIFDISPAETAELRPGKKIPVYPLTAGVYQNQVHRAVLRALAALGSGESINALIDPLPLNIRTEYNLMPLLETLRELHLPSSEARHERARARLAFEEFLVPQLVLAQRRWQLHHLDNAATVTTPESLPALVSRLAPFEPTTAQLRVLMEIEEDLRSSRPMNRLLQGDVGSGKTLVAAGALAFVARSGMQAAIMAPTEILAEQLYLVLSRLLKPLNISPVLLTGSQASPEKQQSLAAIASGKAAIAVGTHALIQKGVEFDNLGLTIVDEQHRFGVTQRATLRGKGKSPNALIMTATPIPRTLSLTAYGDMDVSILDALPPGRHPVETRWVSAFELREAYQFIRNEIADGRQAYVVCPLVDQSDLLQADAATEMAEELRRVFPELSIGLLHGRMRPEEKDAAMEAFRLNGTNILACTTVVEVGVDVPNATVMLINNAERFGLAQLHQLRGRVGRSQHKSTCLLVTHPKFNPMHEGEDLSAKKRLRIMLNEQDGFAIADADLEIRGPGEYFGTRQSGLVDFKIGNILRDGKYLQQAREAAHAMISEDPKFASSHYKELSRRVKHLKNTLDQ